MNIIPIPKHTICLRGKYEGSKTFTVSKDIFEKFSVAWKTFKMDIAPANAGEENVVFLNNPLLDKEEYELNIKKSEIEIISSTDEGAFRAISTLRQIIKNQEIECVKIQDKPDIPVRGIMLAVHQNSLPKLETLYKLVDELAGTKYNMLQLYFDTFVFEYDSFRKYLKGMSYVTVEEIKKLDAYCKERHIELIANQELFGHMAEFLKQDEFKHLGIKRNDGNPSSTVNPLLSETFEFAKRILDDLIPHFSSDMVHIGMDEPYGIGEDVTEAYCKTFGEGDLLAEYITKVNNYVKEKYHKKCMFWGDYAVKFPDAMKKLPKDITFVDWGYEPAHTFERNIFACRDAGMDIYVAPGTQCWGTYSGKTDVMVQNIYEAAEAGRFNKVAGFLLTEWSATQFKYLSYLPYTFGGAFSWNSGYNMSIAESGNEDNCSFRNEVVHAVLDYYDEFVMENKGARSIADVVYKMGNYYHFEQPESIATWNGTQLYNYIYSDGLKRGQLSCEALSDIIWYMERLKSQLEECELGCADGGDVKVEFEFLMDVVIGAANAIGVKYYGDEFTAPDVKALEKRHEAIWTKCNKLSDSAYEIIGRYNKFKEYIG